MRQRIIVVDTETTGLPSQQPAGAVRIMQLGYVVCEVEVSDGFCEMRVVEEYERLVRLDPGTFVDPASQRIHGLSAEVCAVEGVDISEALSSLVRSLGFAQAGTTDTETKTKNETGAETETVLVGHHLDFDMGILAQEARRCGREDWLRTLGLVSTCCTMEWGRDVCRLPMPQVSRSMSKMNKNPKLVELFLFLFGGHLSVPAGLHSAAVDARVCAASYLGLLARGVIGVDAARVAAVVSSQLHLLA